MTARWKAVRTSLSHCGNIFALGTVLFRRSVRFAWLKSQKLSTKNRTRKLPGHRFDQPKWPDNPALRGACIPQYTTAASRAKHGRGVGTWRLVAALIFRRSTTQLESLGHQFRHVLRNRRGRRETRRFDAYQVNSLAHSLVACDDKVGRTFCAGWHKLRSQPGVAQLQVAFFNFRQKFSRASHEFRDRKPIAFVVVLLLDVSGTWPDEHGPPKCLREVHAQTQDIGMWQGIHQGGRTNAKEKCRTAERTTLPRA